MEVAPDFIYFFYPKYAIHTTSFFCISRNIFYILMILHLNILFQYSLDAYPMRVKERTKKFS